MRRFFSGILVLLIATLTACGAGGGSSSSSGGSSPSAPDAPTGLSVATSNQQNSVSWTAVTGATSYNIYWATTTGVTTGTGTKIIGATSAYTHSSLTAGTTYYYIVTAVDATGESPASTEVSGTPTVGVPTGLSATSGTLQNSISWTASTGATSYNIYWATTTGVTTGTGTKITGATSSHVHSPLTAGTTYYYIVTAVDTTGESPASTEVSATPTALGVPTGLSVTPGNQQNSVSWTAVTGATSYNIYWATTTGVTTGTGTKITGATSPHIHNTLTAGTTYYYIVTAVVSTVESSASAEASGTPYIPISLPDTGQTTKYSTAFGDDSDYLINAPSYTDNGDGTITDNITNLIWQKCSVGIADATGCTGGGATAPNWYEATGTADATYNIGGATDVCGSLTLGGSSAWRLPEISELHGIVDYETAVAPMIDTTAFPATTSTKYWSATTVAYNSANAWIVAFNSAFIRQSFIKSDGGYVRCVR